MQSKLPDVGTTIFTVMSQLAQQCNAINLSQGFPSFNPDPALVDRVTHHMQNGANQYAPMSGAPELREAIAQKVHTVYDRRVDTVEQVTVTAGATEALFCAIMATVGPGDEVIIFDPAYDSYEPVIKLAGGITRRVPLSVDEHHEFSMNWQGFKDAITTRTRLVILNFPHNPTGAILAPNDLELLAELLRDSNIYLLSDEVYEHIVFGDLDHQSVLRHDELWERSFIVSSFGKTCHVTGWKVGYCLAPSNLSAEFRKVHQFNCFAVVAPMQRAFADHLTNKPEHYQILADFYENLRDTFARLMEPSGFTLLPARSTFFQIADYSAISKEVDTDFSQRLTREIGVASIPVSVFCEQPEDRQLLRFCFAKDTNTLEDAANRLCQL